MASRSHTRQKSDDSKLAFELVQVQSRLISDEPTFRPPKISCGSVFRLTRSVRSRLTNIARRIATVNLTFICIVVLTLSLVLPVALALVTYFLYPTVVDISLQSFQIPDQVASLRQDAYQVAKSESHSFGHRPRRSADSLPDPWALPSSGKGKHLKDSDYVQSKSSWTMDLTYLALGKDQNMLTVEHLEAAHHVEQQIMKYPGFVDFCWKWKMVRLDPILSEKYNACTPPISLIDFFYPTHSGGMTFFDGQQAAKLTQESMHKTLNFLLSKQFTYWFVDGNFSAENRRSTLLRAQIKFGFPLKGYTIHDSKGAKMHEQNEKHKAFVVKFISFLKTLSNDQIQVLYGGPEVFDYLVNKTMWDDVKLVKYTLIVIIIFVFLVTSFSLFLTLFGILSILVCLPCAYFMFRVMFGIPNVTILSGVSLFVIIGIGVDDVFVFINTFIHAKHSKDIKARLKHTVNTAGGATFFTSFTTAAAFGANCLSKMPAIHDFGLFMMLIVISCWLTVLMVIPPSLYLWHQYVYKLERRFSDFLCKCLPFNGCCVFNSAGLPGDIEHFLAGSSEAESNVHENEACSTDEAVDTGESHLTRTGSSDLLWMSDDGTDCMPLLLTSNERHHRETRNNQSVMCGSSLQLCLFYYTKPVSICRYAFLVLYIVMLGGSAYLNTMITPSDRPPAFFKEGSNLQQLLDLRYNMSGDNYDCKICDDVIEVGSNFINGLPTKSPTKPADRTTSRVPMATTSSTSTPITTRQFVLATKEHKAKPTAHPTKSALGSPTFNTGTKAVTTPHRKSTRPQTSAKLTSKAPLDDVSTLGTLSPQTGFTTKATTTHGNKIPLHSPSVSSVSNDANNDINDRPKIPASPTLSGTPSDPCAFSPCTPVEKPILDSLVNVKVVFGIKGLDRNQVVRQHVIQSKGTVVMDPKFTDLYKNHHSVFIKHMCRICHAFTTNNELVREAGADCFPSWLLYEIQTKYQSYPECHGIKSHTHLNGKSDAKMYKKTVKPSLYHNTSKVVWLLMSFESTINKGIPSREMLKWYNKWDFFLKSQVDGIPELKTAFHTSESWVHMFMEIIAVNGAIYGVVFSLLLCMFAVIIFTGHVMLSFIVILTILGVLCSVVGIFYLVGWHLGAVEAISLSILVGTSVDYCVHLVDGYIISGQYLPNTVLTNENVRVWRTSAAISHIGSSILSSAITTIAASIPLCLTTIQLFAKFGQIVAINTVVSIVYTLTFCMAFLTIMAPSRFCRTYISRLKSLVGVLIFTGMVVLCLYIVSLQGTTIPGPDGNPLFNI